MNNENLAVTIVPLIPNAILPEPASARTRASIPPGYGVQEECLPFTAASALGFIIRSPIRFGLCPLADVPAGGRAFRSPLDQPAADGSYADPRFFYVVDNSICRFRGNAFEFDEIPAGGSKVRTIQEPGISFFDRQDQQDLFKVHLPYIWRTPESVDTLFLPLLNRSAQGLNVLCGIVETDWYASPVNMILRKPAGAVHVQAGDALAHAVFVPREFRRPSLEVVQWHARVSRDARKALAEWDKQHAENRNAYKVLARSRHGRMDAESPNSDGSPPSAQEG
jgi:Family of unknown function (DUF6065)